MTSKTIFFITIAFLAQPSAWSATQALLFYPTQYGSVQSDQENMAFTTMVFGKTPGLAIQRQALIQFDIFGTTQGKVPPGTVIQYAELAISTSCQSTCYGDGTLQRASEIWGPGATWNSMNAGVSGVSGQNAAASTGGNYYNVTAHVQAWSNAPSLNYGWVFSGAIEDNTWAQFNPATAVLRVEFASSTQPPPNTPANPTLVRSYWNPLTPTNLFVEILSNSPDDRYYVAAWSREAAPPPQGCASGDGVASPLYAPKMEVPLPGRTGYFGYRVCARGAAPTYPTTSGVVAYTPPLASPDFDGDCDVDLTDFGVLKTNFGRTNAARTEGDAFGDATVDLADFGFLKQKFGTNPCVYWE